MAASHLALFGLTGSPLTGVFHAASDGNDGHEVPGITGPVAADDRCGNEAVASSPVTSPSTATSTLEKWSVR